MPSQLENKPQVDQNEVINILLGQIANLHLQVALLQSKVKELNTQLKPKD